MDELLDPEFYTIEGEDGEEFELELLDSLEHNGTLYHAFFPAEALEDEEKTGDVEIDLDDEEEGLIILKVIVEEGEEMFSTLDTDEELEEIYALFMERFYEDGEET